MGMTLATPRAWTALLRVAVSTLAAAVLLVGVSVTTASADTQMTATEGVNVRSGPRTKSPIVGGLYRGQTVTAIRSADGWTTVRFNGTTAYIASRYLTAGAKLPAPSEIGAGTVKITTTDLNLRTGPGLSYPVIRVLPEGLAVTLTGKTARGFAEVLAGSSQGWSSLQYLASSANALPVVVGTRTAMADLNIWATSTTTTEIIAEVKKGGTVSITGATQNARAQIIFNNAIRWVTAKYLSNPTDAGPTTPNLPKITGYRYATTTLNIRSTSADKYTKIDEVVRGTQLSITGVVANGRAQIVYNSAVRWVTAKYLATTRPSVTPAPSDGGYAVERGLQPNAIKVHRAAMQAFPQITTYYGVRRDPYPDHPTGHALDLMTPGYPSASARALGFQVAAWARTNARALGIKYVIWDQHIWNIQRDSEGWRYMADRGGASANHKNHVHITVF
jgi:uncharacterized protein YgiM (DUF1202 family)